MALGRQAQYACGDNVTAVPAGPGEAVIESADRRSSLFFRSAAHRTKLIAANATQVAVVVASEPSFSDELVARVLAAAEHGGLRAFILLNKADLSSQSAAA
ncbi:MAG: GTPase RsgA, partial [Betaproteobacteria bacterium]|nr:GTPase RsgA [Betaproteobacteria bacterium]